MCHPGVVKGDIVCADSLLHLLYQGVLLVSLSELPSEHLLGLADEISDVRAQVQGDSQMLLVITFG